MEEKPVGKNTPKPQYRSISSCGARQVLCHAGVALGKCVEYGYTMAKEVAGYLTSDGTAGHVVGPQKTQDDAFYEGEIPVTSGSGNGRQA